MPRRCAMRSCRPRSPHCRRRQLSHRARSAPLPGPPQIALAKGRRLIQAGGRQGEGENDVVEIEFQVAAPTFATEHPELHHYTNFDGLRGIVASNTLWATHFAHLNDATEVMLLKQPMIDALTPRALEALQHRMSGANRHTRRTIARRGASPKVVGDGTRDFVEAMYGAAFKSDIVTPLAEPYLASFCAHSRDQLYEVDNGLLSQWRAYGGSERYCIVFDTLELVRILLQDSTVIIGYICGLLKFTTL
jgi:hypothetical protein